MAAGWSAVVSVVELFSPPADRFPMRISIVSIALVAGANSCNGKPDFGCVFR